MAAVSVQYKNAHDDWPTGPDYAYEVCEHHAAVIALWVDDRWPGSALSVRPLGASSELGADVAKP